MDLGSGRGGRDRDWDRIRTRIGKKEIKVRELKAEVFKIHFVL